MTLLQDITDKVYRKVDASSRTHALDPVDVQRAVRETIAELIRMQPSAMIMLRAATAAGEAMSCRPGDWFLVQHRAALQAILDDVDE